MLLAHVDDALFQLLARLVAPFVGAPRLELTLDGVQLPNPGEHEFGADDPWRDPQRSSSAHASSSRPPRSTAAGD